MVPIVPAPGASLAPAAMSRATVVPTSEEAFDPRRWTSERWIWDTRGRQGVPLDATISAMAAACPLVTDLTPVTQGVRFDEEARDEQGMLLAFARALQRRHREMSPDAVLRLWRRHLPRGPQACAVLFVGGHLFREGPWWDHPTFATQAMEAMESIPVAAPTSIDVQWCRRSLPLVMTRRRERQWSLRTWVRFLAQWDLESDQLMLQSLERQRARGEWAPTPGVLLPLLSHPSGHVRLWAQLQLTPTGDRPAGPDEGAAQDTGCVNPGERAYTDVEWRARVVRRSLETTEGAPWNRSGYPR